MWIIPLDQVVPGISRMSWVLQLVWKISNSVLFWVEVNTVCSFEMHLFQISGIYFSIHTSMWLSSLRTLVWRTTSLSFTAASLFFLCFPLSHSLSLSISWSLICKLGSSAFSLPMIPECVCVLCCYLLSFLNEDFVNIVLIPAETAFFFLFGWASQGRDLGPLFIYFSQWGGSSDEPPFHWPFLSDKVVQACYYIYFFDWRGQCVHSPSKQGNLNEMRCEDCLLW